MIKAPKSLAQNLLIVPYGIETFFTKGSAAGVFVLLIVPYGIETITVTADNLFVALPFNRTLWN